MGQLFHYESDGEEHGPVSAEQLKAAAREGRLKRSGRVRKEGGGWMPAAQIKGLFPDSHEPQGKRQEAHQGIRETLDNAGEVAETVGRGAKTASKVAKATGQVADAVSDMAEAGDKVGKAFTAIAGLSAGGSTLLGGVGDFLRPVGNVNLMVFAVALLSAVVLFVVARRKGTKIKLKFKTGTIVSLVVALVFGLWSGLGAVASKDNKGVLATNIPAVERAQAAVLPVPQPPVVERPAEEKVGEVRRFEVPPAVYQWVVFSPDGKRVLYCGLSPSTKDKGYENLVIEWDWQSRKELRRVPLPPKAFHDADFSPDRKLLVLSAFRDAGDDLLWDVEAGKVSRPLERPGKSFVRAAFCPDNRHVVLCGGDAIGLVDTSTGKVVRRFAGADVKGTHRLAVSPDGSLLYTSGPGRPALVWDAASGKSLREVPMTQRTFCRPAFSRDGRFVLDGGKGEVRLWDVDTGKEAGSFDGLDEFRCAAFSKDGKLLVTGHAEAGSEGDIRVWDVAGRKEVVRLKGHSERCGECVDVSTDGKHAVSSGQDGTVRVWRLPKAEGTQTEARPVPAPPPGEKGWISLMDTQEMVQRHWKQGDNTGSFFYDPAGRTIRTKAFNHLGTFSSKGRWREFRLEVETVKEPMYKFEKGFHLLKVNGTGLDLGEAFRLPKGPIRIAVRYDPRTQGLTALVGDKVVEQATVTGADWGKSFECQFHGYGGHTKYELAIREARLLPEVP